MFSRHTEGEAAAIESLASLSYMPLWVFHREADDLDDPAALRGKRVAIIGTGANGLTRPLCAYPQVATYKGTGSTNDADNFVCKAP